MNKVGAGLIIAGSIVIGLGVLGTVSVFGSSNHAITLENNVEKYVNDIDNCRYSANTKLGNLESAIDSSNEQYEEIIAAISAARDSDFTTATDNLTTAVNLIVENYPDEPGNKKLYEDYMYTVCDVVEQVTKAADKYNTMVKDYKTYTTKFPNSALLSIAGHEVKDYQYITLTVSAKWSDKQYV